MKKILGLAICFSALFLTACNDLEKLSIVTTTTMITDLTSIIGGECVEVNALMNEGVDPHYYEATAQDTTKLANADAVIYSGLDLEAAMASAIDSIDGAICIADSLSSNDILKDEDGAVDPHFWWDISLWNKAASHIAVELGKIDEDNKEYYMGNYYNYAQELELLEVYVYSRVNELYTNEKFLVTSHDAFSYFGSSTGFNVMAVQGTSTTQEASISNINEVISYVNDNNIKVLFGESSVSDASLNAVLAGVSSNVTICDEEIYSDSLGSSSVGHGTYLSAYKANVDVIINAIKKVR